MQTETDPFEWSAEEAANYVRHKHGSLAQQLLSHDLNGRMLLEHVNLAVLRDDLGVLALRERILIMQMICALRSSSAAYAQSLTPTHQALASPIPTPTATTGVEPIGSRIRSGETLVEDSNGRKRRRLDPTSFTTSSDTQPGAEVHNSSPPPESTTPALTSAFTGHLRDEKHTVDDLFYGQTSFGSDIQHHNSDDEDEDNFQIFGHFTIPGNSIFVSGKLRFAFQRAQPQTVTYRNQPALAVYPYAESSIKPREARSVTIFQPSDNGVKAIRENAQTLHYQKYEAVTVQGSPGPFSHLLDKYLGSDELLPKYGDADYDYSAEDVDYDSDHSGADNDSMAEEDTEAESPSLPLEVVTSLIDKTVELQAQSWRDVQPSKLDKSEARRVWRFARGKSKMVHRFTEEANKKINELNKRLEQLKRRLLDRSWDKEQEVEQACASLEPTVNDREHQHWRIEVWALKQEPVSAARSRRPSHKTPRGPAQGVHNQETTDDGMDDFIVEDEDFEDARESLSADGHTENDVDMKESASSSDLLQEASAVTPGANNDTAEAMEIGEGLPKTTEVPAEFEYNNLNQKVIPTPKSERFAVNLEVEPESPGLPSLESLFQSRPSTAQKQRQDVIMIPSSPAPDATAPTMSQASPSEDRSVKNEQAPQKSNNEHLDDDQIVASWTYEELEESEERVRLMYKMVYDLDERQRKRLLSLFTGNMTTCFAKVRAALSAINQKTGKSSDYSKKEWKTMQHAARLYLCCLHNNHKLFNADISQLHALSPDWPWHGLDADYADDLCSWHRAVKDALQSCKRSLEKHKGITQQEPIEITDDDDDKMSEDESKDQSGHSSVRKRRKRVAKDQDAARKRAKAAERAALYESQNQASQGTSSMVGEGGDGIVPLYTPSDVDSSKHVYLNPDIARRLKPHQIEGVKFMWREITAPEDEDGQGCLLAHTMGLGKTAQSLALLTAVAETVKDGQKRGALPDDIKKAKDKFRALILCPPALMANWRQEIRIWCPEKLFNVFALSSDITTKAARLDELCSWRRLGGIMLCGYTMFTRLVHGKTGKNQIFSDQELDDVQKILLRKTHLVIADEVHYIKSDTSKSSSAAHQIKTHRRIGLTGSPMSNNTAEIFALIDWVAPKFLGSKEEFKSHYQGPIEAGTYKESSKSEVRKSMTKLAALKEIISPKLNRADITVLKGSLKSKVEFVLIVALTDTQKSVYTAYVRALLGDRLDDKGTVITQAKLFGWLSILQLLCNHPIVFRRKLLEPKPANKKGKKSLPPAAEVEVHAGPSTASASTAGVALADPFTTPLPAADTIAAEAYLADPFTAFPSTAAVADEAPKQQDGQSPADDEEAAYADRHVSQYDIHKPIVEALLEVVPESDAIELSYKTLLVRKIMNLSVEAGDKVLIFSQSIPSLNFLDKMLAAMGFRYGRIQGDIAQDKREKVLKAMADNKLDVLLISTRAGGLGLNIQQANRVIIFDFSFNPTWEEQAIGRAYRLGQTKPVFVYRFVAGGTFEFSLYDKQLFKTGLASRVVDKKNPMRNAQKKPGEWLKPPIDVLQQVIEVETGKDEHVMDRIIASQVEGDDQFIRSIKTMETLMEESKDEALTAEEMQEVQNDVLLARSRKLANTSDGRTTVAPPQAVAGVEPSVTTNVHGDFIAQQLTAGIAHEQLAQQMLPPEVAGSSQTSGARIIGRY